MGGTKAYENNEIDPDTLPFDDLDDYASYLEFDKKDRELIEKLKEKDTELKK